MTFFHAQFKPMEQLMSVFPAASGKFLPETWRELMTDIVSNGHRGQKDGVGVGGGGGIGKVDEKDADAEFKLVNQMTEIKTKPEGFQFSLMCILFPGNP